jgi:hypothetical protein
MPTPDWAALRVAPRHHFVNAAGSRRRMGAMALRRIAAATVEAGCGRHRDDMAAGWLSEPTVRATAAAAVHDYYVANLHVTGTAGDAVPDRAATLGALPDHAWTDDDPIDDPRARPWTFLPHTGSAVTRRLRALIHDGHPVDSLAAELREWPPVVFGWVTTGRVRRYTLPFVVALYDRLAGTLGKDAAASALARERHWRGSMAWYDIDIDDPLARARTDAPPRLKVDVDPQMVLGGVGGWVFRADLTSAELKLVVRELGATLSARQIAEQLRWSSTGDDAAGAVHRYASDHRIKVRSDAVLAWWEKGPPRIARAA